MAATVRSQATPVAVMPAPTKSADASAQVKCPALDEALIRPDLG